ncbi:MAG TPA: FAD-dependent oxidoreductase [Tepidisphaeraceae bacterium]|jgi:NADPH-dependent 2,4-dienoyl-CoA reductase/sulfur reductase-like enzyme|nr:FAD-dependent oxidoreductase [Tepidisphaeraceae bacterium]
MAVHRVRYLLIGGGLASSSAAQAIREIDADGTIMLVAQEIVRPYHRPPLSKEFLRREKTREALFTLDRDWFEAHRVELRTGRRAAHLDVTRSAVTLDQGEVVGYDKLLLATGMLPRHLEIPGANLPNLFYLRTLADAEQLHKAVDKATHEGHPHTAASRSGPRGKAAVIGGGVLGVELAASLTQVGISVDLLCGEAYPWSKFAGEITGKAVAAFLEKRGVRVHGNSRPLRLEGDGRVQKVVLGDGQSIDCDFAVAAVGAIAHRELLRGTPIAAEKAILTDAHCRTNVPDVYAAGDCAAIFDPLFGRHRILDHWDNASVTGALAGRNMAGRDEAYSAVNNFFSDVFELSMNTWGEARHLDRRIVRNGHSAGNDLPDIIEVGVLADGRISQVLAVGHGGDDALLRGLVAARAPIAGLEERLKDPAFPLQKLSDVS